jgi:AraC-like DNA-binding protein
MLTFLATSDIATCTQNYDRAISGYCTIQFTRGARLCLGYDEDWHDIPPAPAFWPAYPGPRLRFHRAEGEHHWHHTHIAFTGPQILRWEEEGLWPFAPQAAPKDQDWEAFIATMRQHILTPTPFSQRRAQNLLESLLIDLAEAQHAPITPTAEWLRPLLLALQEDFAPDYRQWAQRLSLSESTLRRRFRAQMGVPIHEYTIERRLARARLLLIDTNTPLKSIAAQLGYESEYFFSRQFKQRMGVSPRLYRQSR